VTSRKFEKCASKECQALGSDSVLKDPQLLAEAEKARLAIDPIDGPGIEKMVNGLYEIEPAVVSRVKQILESK
jgi:hypothetical protein